MGCGKGQGGDDKKVGGRGWGKGGGVRWGAIGVESIFKWSFEQNRYRYIDFGYQNAHYEMKSAEIVVFGGFPQFLAGNPCGMTSQSRKSVIISPKKSPKMRRQEISPNYLCKKEQPSWKSAHFEFLNSNNSVFGHDFKPKMEISTDFSVIWRWYKRLVTAFSSFWVKIGGWCGPRAHGSRNFK